MIGYIVKFKNGEETLKGTIRDKYMGFKWIDVVSHSRKVRSYVSIDYYLIEIDDEKLFHVPCNEILEIIKIGFPSHIPPDRNGEISDIYYK